MPLAGIIEFFSEYFQQSRLPLIWRSTIQRRREKPLNLIFQWLHASFRLTRERRKRYFACRRLRQVRNYANRVENPMLWKLAANFFFWNPRSLIGHDRQNQSLSRFRMIDSVRGAFIHSRNRRDSRLHFRKTHANSFHFYKDPFTPFDP